MQRPNGDAARAPRSRHQPNFTYRAKTWLQKIGWILFRSILLFGVSFIILYPLIYMLSMAFRDLRDMVDPAIVWIPKHLTLDAVKDSFAAMDYPRSLWNTVRLDLVSSLLQVVSCALVGYGFARFQFKGKRLFFALAVFTIVIPPQVVYTPTYLFYRNFDFLGLGSLIGAVTGTKFSISLLDSGLTLYLPALFGVGIRSGLFIYIFRQFYRALPKELEDAAYIDGCGFVKTFLRVIAPNARGAFLTVFLFSVVWYWNDYYFTTMYFTHTHTVSTALASLPSLLSLQKGMTEILNDAYLIVTRLQAGCLLTILPILVLYVFLQKYFTEGLERSGLVG